MTQKIHIADLPEFDAAEYLEDDQAIAEYLAVVMEEDDPAALAQALGTVARARGMTELARTTGIPREALYEALHPGTQPCSDTMQRVCSALGVKPTAKFIPKAHPPSLRETPAA